MNKEKHLTDLAKKIEAAKRQKLAIECRTNVFWTYKDGT